MGRWFGPAPRVADPMASKRRVKKSTMTGRERRRLLLWCRDATRALGWDSASAYTFEPGVRTSRWLAATGVDDARWNDWMDFRATGATEEEAIRKLIGKLMAAIDREMAQLEHLRERV